MEAVVRNLVEAYDELNVKQQRQLAKLIVERVGWKRAGELINKGELEARLSEQKLHIDSDPGSSEYSTTLTLPAHYGLMGLKLTWVEPEGVFKLYVTTTKDELLEACVITPTHAFDADSELISYMNDLSSVIIDNCHNIGNLSRMPTQPGFIEGDIVWENGHVLYGSSSLEKLCEIYADHKAFYAAMFYGWDIITIRMTPGYGNSLKIKVYKEHPLCVSLRMEYPEIPVFTDIPVVYSENWRKGCSLTSAELKSIIVTKLEEEEKMTNTPNFASWPGNRKFNDKLGVRWKWRGAPSESGVNGWLFARCVRGMFISKTHTLACNVKTNVMYIFEMTPESTLKAISEASKENQYGHLACIRMPALKTKREKKELHNKLREHALILEIQHTSQVVASES